MKSLPAIVGLSILFLLPALPVRADQRFQARLTAAQEVPTNGSPATGVGTVRLNTAETQITVNMSFANLTSTPSASHIHGAAFSGTNAGILFDFSGVLPGTTSGSIPEQTFSITAPQVTQLKAGQFYFNIHTANFGGGEIRGQILIAPAQKFLAVFSGAQEVPPTGSAATGSGTVLLNATEDQITVNASWANLTSAANAGHIHGPAPPGMDAGIVFPFSGVPAATSGAIPEQSFAISAAQVVDLKAGQYYFNIHSDTFGGGEIRGQILLAPTQRFVTPLVSWQEVPPNSSTATGTGTVLLTAAEDQIIVDVNFSGLTSAASAGHIHGPAAAGSNAGILFPLAGVPAATSGAVPQQTFSITPSQVAQLKAGQFYVNIHSSMFGDGEIRGQLLLAPVRRSVATLSGSQEVPPNVSPATGSGTVLLNSTEDQIIVNGNFATLTTAPTAGHVHGPAPAGSIAGILFPLAALPGGGTTSQVIPDQTFAITPAQMAQLTASQFYINIHSTTFPDGEIRGQIVPVPTLRVSKTVTGTSSGTVTSSPAGITCGADCAEAYNSGSMVTLTAGAPAAGSFFVEWTGGGCAAGNPCVVTLTADTTVTAKYAATSFSFTDESLTAGQTVVRAVHVLELRQAINTLRSNNSLAPFAFTDPTLVVGATVITAQHVSELRTALNAVYTQQQRPLPNYTDPMLTGLIVRGVHISEIRVAVRLVE